MIPTLETTKWMSSKFKEFVQKSVAKLVVKLGLDFGSTNSKAVYFLLFCVVLSTDLISVH